MHITIVSLFSLELLSNALITNLMIYINIYPLGRQKHTGFSSALGVATEQFDTFTSFFPRGEGELSRMYRVLLLVSFFVLSEQNAGHIQIRRRRRLTANWICKVFENVAARAARYEAAPLLWWGRTGNKQQHEQQQHTHTDAPTHAQGPTSNLKV